MSLTLKYEVIYYILCRFNLPVTSSTAVCAHRNIEILRLLLKEKLQSEGNWDIEFYSLIYQLER